MISQNMAQENIARSGKRVRDAADRWNAVDLFEISQCLSALDHSAADLSDAIGILKESPATAAGLIRSDIESLRTAALRLERLVDASATFLRLAPGPTGDDDGFYQSGGSLCNSAPPPEVRGTQV
jgi:hypothetical protein